MEAPQRELLDERPHSDHVEPPYNDSPGAAFHQPRWHWRRVLQGSTDGLLSYGVDRTHRGARLASGRSPHRLSSMVAAHPTDDPTAGRGATNVARRSANLPIPAFETQKARIRVYNQALQRDSDSGAAETGESIAQGGRRKRKGRDSQRGSIHDTFILRGDRQPSQPLLVGPDIVQ